MPEDTHDTAASITDLAHKRDDDGALLPVTETVTVRGEGPAEVELYPATTGQRNEWQDRLQDQPEELPDDITAELLEEFAAYSPADFGEAETWDDVRPAITDALGNAVLARLFDAPTDAFADALEERAAEATAGNPD